MGAELKNREEEGPMEEPPTRSSPGENPTRQDMDELWASTGAGATLGAGLPILIGSGALVLGPLSPVVFGIVGGAAGFIINRGLRNRVH